MQKFSWEFCGWPFGFDMLNVFFNTDTNYFTVIAFSEMNPSLLVQMYFQSKLFSSLFKENKCLFLCVRFSLMKARSQVGFPEALCFNFFLYLQILFLG